MAEIVAAFKGGKFGPALWVASLRWRCLYAHVHVCVPACRHVCRGSGCRLLGL